MASNTKSAIRQALRPTTRQVKKFLDMFRSDERFLDPKVPLSTNAHLGALVEQFNRPGLRILEIGSREVTGASEARRLFGRAEYVGFDYHPGPNVDVVGDAHRLLEYFEGQRFDLIYSEAVFEHLAMPWLVTPQIAQLLNVGGQVLIATHFSYSSHERPWHFFQFSDMALRVLFPPALGIDCIEAGASNPMIGYFSSHAAKVLRYKRVTGLYCGSEFLGRKVREVANFDWTTLELRQVVADTEYPQPGPRHDL